MNDNTDEIDLIELLKKIYLEKKLILKISVLAALFGEIGRGRVGKECRSRWSPYH